MATVKLQKYTKRLGTEIKCSCGDEGLLWLGQHPEEQQPTEKTSPYSLLLPSAFSPVPLLGETNREPAAKEKWKLPTINPSITKPNMELWIWSLIFSIYLPT